MVGTLSRLIMAALLCLLPLGALAQTPAAASSQALLKPAELDQLVAPIALYPDALLSEVLIASTYPLEVVQADRWAKSNNSLKGEALTAALAKQGWDDSVKALAQVPNVLTIMADQLEWTQKLGDAVLAQQPELMDAIQRLRGRAQANGKLQSTKEQTVTVESAAPAQGGGGQAQEGQAPAQYIVIEPTSPTEMYVPYYDPAVVYGAWPYPDYSPYYFPPPPGYYAGGAIAAGIAFGSAVAIGHAIWGNCDWGRRNINVANRNVNINNLDRSNINNFNKWEHNADHRHGVKYNNADVRQKFAKNDIQAGKGARQDFRGKDGQKVIDSARPGAGNRPGAGDRPGGEDRDRSGAGDRPGAGASKGGERPTARSADRPGGGQKAAQKPAQKPAAKPSASRADRPGGGQKAAQKPAQKPAAKPSTSRDTAFSNVQSGAKTRAQADRGRQSMGGGGGAPRVAGGGGGGSSRQPRWRGSSWRWRRRRAWWRWRRTPVRHRPEARHRAARPACQWPELLSFQLLRQREGLCRCHGARGAKGCTAGGETWSRRIPAGLLRAARPWIPNLQAVDRIGRASPHCPTFTALNAGTHEHPFMQVEKIS